MSNYKFTEDRKINLKNRVRSRGMSHFWSEKSGRKRHLVPEEQLLGFSQKHGPAPDPIMSALAAPLETLWIAGTHTPGGGNLSSHSTESGARCRIRIHTLQISGVILYSWLKHAKMNLSAHDDRSKWAGGWLLEALTHWDGEPALAPPPRPDDALRITKFGGPKKGLPKVVGGGGP